MRAGPHRHYDFFAEKKNASNLTGIIFVSRDYEADVTYKKGGRVIDADDLVFANKSKTGDQFRLVLWSSIMVGSLVAIVVLLIVWKKRKK